MKKSFILYTDSLDVLSELSNEQAGELFKAISAFERGENFAFSSQLLKIAFVPFKNQLERDLEKYNSICERNAMNGAKGGRPRKNPINPLGCLETQITQANPKEPKKAYSDNDNDNDNDNDSEKEKKRERIKNFSPPSLEELKNFMKEKEYVNFSEKFHTHYESIGWKVGKNKMKDWKAGVRGWVARTPTLKIGGKDHVDDETEEMEKNEKKFNGLGYKYTKYAHYAVEEAKDKKIPIEEYIKNENVKKTLISI